MRMISEEWMRLFSPDDEGGGAGEGEGDAGGEGSVAGGDTGGEGEGDAGDKGDSTLAGGDEGDKSGDEGGEGKPDGGSDGAPEKYEAFSVPDGYEIEEAVLELASPVFRELGLSQEAGQKLIDLNIEAQKAHAERDAQIQKDWVEEIKKDPDMGGANFDKNVKLVQGAARHYGGEAFQKLLNETGLGNHPDMVRTLLNIGRASAEDTFGGQQRQGSGDSEQSKLRKRYPKMAAQLDAEAGK